MFTPDDARARRTRLASPAGGASRDLRLAIGTIRFEGIAPAHAEAMEARWKGFVGAAGPGPAEVRVRAVAGDGAAWLPLWKPGEGYRLEAAIVSGALVVQSYHFALASEGADDFKLAVEDSGAEPLGRILDNAARYLVARRAIDLGGFALHGAGVRRFGRGYVFAGPSRSGKSTAVRLSAPAESLGDDFAVVVPDVAGWATCALPFDNAERAPEPAVRGLVPLARVARLFQAPSHRLERPEGVIAQASLLACAAFPWAIPDAADRAAGAIAKLSAAGLFVHLHFAPDPGFWRLLEGTA